VTFDWIPDTVKEAKGEWGLKSVAGIGIWIIMPIFNDLSISNIGDIIILALLTLFVIFANYIFQDLLRPALDRYNKQKTHEYE